MMYDTFNDFESLDWVTNMQEVRWWINKEAIYVFFDCHHTVCRCSPLFSLATPTNI